MPSIPAPVPVQTLAAFCGDTFRVAHGVNLGDALAPARDLELEDIYELAETARTGHLSFAADPETGGLFLADETGLGQAGAPVFLDSLLTFMGPNGTTDEVLLIVETDRKTGLVAATYLHPFTPLAARLGYTLVTISHEGARARLAQSACVSFTRGTAITLADGRQVPIEDLAPGDRVLTRDSGPQPLRWIGAQTMRATGAFAPITIAAGALHNTGALTVSPNHRLFIYQRVDAMGAGQAEIMAKARHLVNGTSVVMSEGGFVDYFQLLFDKHEIIYAEGIAAESLFVDPSTRPAVPDEVRKRLEGEATPVHAGLELTPADLADESAIDRLRRASQG